MRHSVAREQRARTAEGSVVTPERRSRISRNEGPCVQTGHRIAPHLLDGQPYQCLNSAEEHRAVGGVVTISDDGGQIRGDRVGQEVSSAVPLSHETMGFVHILVKSIDTIYIIEIFYMSMSREHRFVLDPSVLFDLRGAQ